MKRGLFPLLITSMSLAMLGIILVQVFWIQTNLSNRERQFELNVSLALADVSEKLKEREFQDYLAVYQKMIDSIGAPKASQLTEVFQYIDRSPSSNKTYIYQQGIIEDNFNIYPQSFDSLSNDTLPIFDYRTVKSTTIIDESFEDEIEKMSSVERLQRVERMPNLDKAKYESIFMDFASTKPIQKRLSILELELLLRQELQVRDIRIPFEFRVFDGNRMTVVGSENYLAYLGENQFKTPLFLRVDDSSRYELRLAFPGQKRFVRSSIMNSVFLSLLFIIIILVVFGVSLSQILKQKKISEIKTDFINNMTHEFKTPIATINLALDALINPKVSSDSKKVSNYLDMIRHENKRMNTQVEHVLQISQLEKKELDLVKEIMDPMKTLTQALDHVRLMIDQRGGALIENFDPKLVKINISRVHLTNVWVNLLENAVKYSPDALEVTVTTHVTQDGFEVQIKDRGKGMSASVKKRIFDKFYREPTGNIHNVKGHGLGLSYVKQIIALHSGTISVESEPKQGSNFKVWIPFDSVAL